jgi:hypothetical protein
MTRPRENTLSGLSTSYRKPTKLPGVGFTMEVRRDGQVVWEIPFEVVSRPAAES